MAVDKISVRINPEDYAAARSVFEELGISTAAAVSAFFKAVAREEGIPFPLTTKPIGAAGWVPAGPTGHSDSGRHEGHATPPCREADEGGPERA